MAKNRVKVVLVGCVFFLCLAASVSYGSTDVTVYEYRALGPNEWAPISFDLSEGEKLIATWLIPSGNTIDVMVLNEANYSLFIDGLLFETFFTLNNSDEGYFKLEDLPPDLYIAVFFNDAVGGITMFYHVTLVELPCDLRDPDTTLTLIMSLTGFGVGAITMAAIALVLWRLKMRNY